MLLQKFGEWIKNKLIVLLIKNVLHVFSLAKNSNVSHFRNATEAINFICMNTEHD
jgi:hypothetical protein